MKFHQKGMVNLGENLLFSHDMLLLISFDDKLFLEGFQGIQLVVFLVPDKKDLGIGSAADEAHHLEVIY